MKSDSREQSRGWYAKSGWFVVVAAIFIAAISLTAWQYEYAYAYAGPGEGVGPVLARVVSIGDMQHIYLELGNGEKISTKNDTMLENALQRNCLNREVLITYTIHHRWTQAGRELAPTYSDVFVHDRCLVDN